jgi:hypothetical protein
MQDCGKSATPRQKKTPEKPGLMERALLAVSAAIIDNQQRSTAIAAISNN